MKAIGKIGNIEVDFKNEKTSREGIPYTSERVTVYFEAGDDIHMVQVFNSVFNGQTSEECLRRRNLFIGARGEMTISYSFRDYNGRRYPDVQLVRWVCDNAQAEPSPSPASAPTTQPEATAQQVAEGMAESAAAVEGTINPETGLPF